MHKATSSCCNTNYYGQSERHFFVRVAEYLDMTPLTGNRVNNYKKSAIFDCILLMGHGTSFDEFTILLKKQKKFKLHLKGSLLIRAWQARI